MTTISLSFTIISCRISYNSSGLLGPSAFHPALVGMAISPPSVPAKRIGQQREDGPAGHATTGTKKPPGTLAIKSLVPNKMETKKQLCDYEINFLESFSGTPNKMETNPHKRWELLRKILGISGAGTDVPRSWQTVASWPGTLWQLDRRGSASHFFNGAPRKSCGNLGNLEISLEIHHRNPIFGHFSASCWGNSCFESRAACSRACWSWILYHASEQVPILEALSKFGLTFCSYAAHRAIWKHRTQYCPPPELHTS